MKRLVSVATVLILTLLVTTLFAQALDWKLLGTRKVKQRTEMDVIGVGPREGTFKAIKLTVNKAGIHFLDMKVHFTNGDVIDVQIRNLIPAGGETRVIDLPGANRNLEKVTFWYKTVERSNDRATIRLWGLR